MVLGRVGVRNLRSFGAQVPWAYEALGCQRVGRGIPGRLRWLLSGLAVRDLGSEVGDPGVCARSECGLEGLRSINFRAGLALKAPE
jgi:hypothetical protein